MAHPKQLNERHSNLYIHQVISSHQSIQATSSLKGRVLKTEIQKHGAFSFFRLGGEREARDGIDQMTILAQCQPPNQPNKKIAQFLEAICEVALHKLPKKLQSVSSSTHSSHSVPYTDR